MIARSAPRCSRRSFLKFGAVAAAGLLAPRVPPTNPSFSNLRVKSALPLTGSGFLPFPEQLLEGSLNHLDVALVPAYVAATLIQNGRLQALDGPTGRAHDPEARTSQRRPRQRPGQICGRPRGARCGRRLDE